MTFSGTSGARLIVSVRGLAAGGQGGRVRSQVLFDEASQGVDVPGCEPLPPGRERVHLATAPGGAADC